MTDLQQFLKDYKWPILTVLAALLIAFLYFGMKFPQELLSNVGDSTWWADNLLSFVTFTVFVSWLVSLSQNAKERSHRAQFEGWTLIVTELDEKGKITTTKQELFWQDVERFLASAFERWKFVKSLASGNYWLSLLTIDRAEAGEQMWVVREGKTIGADVDKEVIYGG